MIKNQTTINQIRDYVVEIVKNQKIENTSQLIRLVQEKYSLSTDEVTQIIVELGNKNMLVFARTKLLDPTKLKTFLFSSQSLWYWLTMTLAIATAVTVFTISENTYPLLYLRSFFGLLFVMFLPGFTVIKALYPFKIPLETSSENLDRVERIALSIGLSLVLTPTVGLLLNYTSWGIQSTPATLSLLGLSIIFATVALVREYLTR